MDTHYYNLGTSWTGGADVQTDMGAESGPAPDNCVDGTIQWRQAAQQQVKPTPLSPGPWSVSLYNGSLVLTDNPAGELVQYRVSDVNGRLLASGLSAETHATLYQLPTNAPRSLLIIQLVSRTRSQTFKIQPQP